MYATGGLKLCESATLHIFGTCQPWIPRMSCGKPDRSEVYNDMYHSLTRGKSTYYFCLFVCSEAQVDSEGV